MVDKRDIRYIAKVMIEDLREMNDGEATSTFQLFSEYGYDNDEYDSDELFALHDLLFRFARANHIKLDMSAHEDNDEELPYNLYFIVRNKKAQIKCPRCGSINTARYFYGLPVFSEKMHKMLDEGKWVLGGCCISRVEINGQHIDIMPRRRCNVCKKDFATAPILITPKKDLAEDYRNIVDSIKFSVGGLFEGNTEVTISKNENGAMVKVMKFPYGIDAPEDKQITPAKWSKIVNTLYGQLYLHEWKKEFVDPCVLDGIQWRLDIKLTKRRVRHY